MQNRLSARYSEHFIVIVLFKANCCSKIQFMLKYYTQHSFHVENNLSSKQLLVLPDFLRCDILDLVKEEKVGWVCNHSKNGSVCKISCKEPKEFESPPAPEYKCTPDGVWQPDKLPRCVIKDKGKYTAITFD